MPLNRRGSVSARLRVWFSRGAPRGTRRASRVEHLEAAAVERARAPPRRATSVQRGALLRCPPRSAAASRPGSRRREADACPGRFGARARCQCRRPAIIRWSTRKRSPSSAERRSACRSAAAPHPLPVAARERRIDGAQQERAREPDALERLADDARRERLEVDGDVGQLGHGRSSPGRHQPVQRRLLPEQADHRGSTALRRRRLHRSRRELGQILREALEGVGRETGQPEAGERAGRGSRGLVAGARRGRCPTARGRAAVRRARGSRGCPPRCGGVPGPWALRGCRPIHRPPALAARAGG